MEIVFKICSGIVITLQKIKAFLLRSRINKLEGELFDAKLTNKQEHAKKDLESKAEKKSSEKSIDEIINHFGK